MNDSQHRVRGVEESSGTGTESETAAGWPEAIQPPREVGGRDGPDPVRYGDWEKNGRCIDF